MEEKDLVFDKQKHLIYSKEAKKIALEYLSSKLPCDNKFATWEKVQKVYLKFLDSLPYIGGKRNFQAQTVYDCLLFFAVYEAMDDKPTLEELEKMNDDLFVPAYQRLSFVNFNNPFILRLANTAFKIVERGTKKHKDDWPGNYVMDVMPFAQKTGIRYKFTNCPIASFANKMGYSHLMPSFCNSDYKMLEKVHAGLIRTHTLGEGPYCDYRITGDKHPDYLSSAIKRNKKGFLKSE